MLSRAIGSRSTEHSVRKADILYGMRICRMSQNEAVQEGYWVVVQDYSLILKGGMVRGRGDAKHPSQGLRSQAYIKVHKEVIECSTSAVNMRLTQHGYITLQDQSM
jgi:hypothetical protein